MAVSVMMHHCLLQEVPSLELLDGVDFGDPRPAKTKFTKIPKDLR